MKKSLKDVPYSLQKQYIPPDRLNDVTLEIDNRLGEKSIFVGGTAYKFHVLNRLVDRDIPSEEAKKKISYRKDIDFFIDDTDEAIKSLGSDYTCRNPEIYRYAGAETTRKRHIGRAIIRMPLPINERVLSELEKEEVYNELVTKLRTEKRDFLMKGDEIPAFVGVDIMGPEFYTSHISEQKRGEVIDSLKNNKQHVDLLGKPIYISGLDDLLLAKIANIRGYPKHICDIGNLLYLFEPEEFDIKFLTDVLGKDKVLSRVGISEKYISRSKSLDDSTLPKIIREQEVPYELKCSHSLIVTQRENLLKAIESFKKSI